MKIQGVELNENSKFEDVVYVPDHAEGNVDHQDVEHGYISSWNDDYVFVNFGGVRSKAVRPENLVWDC